MRAMRLDVIKTAQKPVTTAGMVARYYCMAEAVPPQEGGTFGNLANLGTNSAGMARCKNVEHYSVVLKL